MRPILAGLAPLHLAPLALALALAGCGGPAEQAGNASPGQPDTSAMVNAATAVIALPVDSRNAVFLRAIRDSGIACQDVNESEQIEATQGMPTWRAKCDNGAYHLVAIRGDGTAIVMSRPGS